MTDEQARTAATEAADRLFYERGIRGVRVEEVRDASGVSLKLLYKLFPTKEQLAGEALRRRQMAFISSLIAFVETRRTARDKVLAIFDYLDEWFREPGFRGCGFINAFGEMGATSGYVLAAARSQKTALRETVGNLVRDAGGTPALADQITMLVNGATVSAAILEDPQAARRAKQAARSLLEARGV